MNDILRKQVEAILTEVGQGAIRPYFTYNFGRSKDKSCLSVLPPMSRVGYVLYDVRSRLPAGAVAFQGTDSQEIVVGPAEDQFDIVRLARTQAPQYGLTTEDIVNKLREYHALVDIDIRHAETEVVEFNLKNVPANVEEFVSDVLVLCADFVTKHGGSAESLVSQIKVRKYLYLWWDQSEG